MRQDVVTGDTLCEEKSPIVLERMDFPDPVIKIAIEPKSKGDAEKMTTGLIKLAQEDPSFHFSREEETNQTVREGGMAGALGGVQPENRGCARCCSVCRKDAGTGRRCECAGTILVPPAEKPSRRPCAL